MYTCAVRWPGSPDDILKSPLQRYDYGKDSSILFCGACGTPVFAQKRNNGDVPDVLYLPVGLLPNLDVDLVKIVQHVWVGDTLDGGASVFMQKLNSDTALIPRWEKNAGAVDEARPGNWPPYHHPEAVSGTALDSVPVRCHCRGVDFTLRRDDAGYNELKAQGRLPTWVNPTTLKPIAGYDACDSCRFMVAAPLMHWTFARLAQLEFAGGEGESKAFPGNTLELKRAVKASDDGRFGTLTFYESSPDVQRYYCSRCSASVFYAVDELADQVDISMGLLHAPEGARAESWVEWEWGGLGHKADAAGGWRERFCKAIQDGSEEWRVAQGLPKGHRFP
ncbi:hypothetical protein NQ176_g10151 [Zarea fungicola]|uniref:Uncharacterized protein n=1 Tax=Zarea fungicola TaxID=93591 RepID=A0ACC1MHE1_9HYPO|nr:hypothetical protein NQ176_g10151 [Lecanicillium fungicola]